jgi:predicted acylesterase/phospholipase RssA
MIEHLVFSGGAIVGFTYLGMLKYLTFHKEIDMSKMKSFRGTSIGCIIATLLAMKYSCTDIEDYAVNLNWLTMFDFNISTLIEALRVGGVFNKTTIIKLIKPFFLGKDFSIDITLQELYEYNPVDLYLYSTNLTDFTLTEFSHKTHPSMTVIDALYASCAIPVVFCPLQYENKVYIDGAIFLNYPLQPCIDEVEDVNTIMGFLSSYDLMDTGSNSSNKHLEPGQSKYMLLEYLYDFFMKIWKRISYDKLTCRDPSPQQFCAKCSMSYDEMVNCMKYKENRERMILLGVGIAADIVEGKMKRITTETTSSINSDSSIDEQLSL